MLLKNSVKTLFVNRANLKKIINIINLIIEKQNFSNIFKIAPGLQIKYKF